MKISELNGALGAEIQDVDLAWHEISKRLTFETPPENEMATRRNNMAAPRLSMPRILSRRREGILGTAPGPKVKHQARPT